METKIARKQKQNKNEIYYGNHWCKIYRNNKNNNGEEYGREQEYRENNGCSGSYFYTYYTPSDHKKNTVFSLEYLKNKEDAINEAFGLKKEE